ncbi:MULTISPECIES: hypothetical protein [unclassified Yoonia]|uniref:hypothetical protein n=1 Tax=unclassified Yoonia TaxID=2629118 RepID=UPI002AFE4BC1|nr:MULTISPECIES: hypothetical protein [unclassified Yoonia]
MLHQDTLTAFMNTFMGYGDFDAETWFIGMEEAGGNTLQDVQIRIGTWEERGRRTLEDCAEYHQAIGVAHLFTSPVRAAQPTWDWLMRAQLKSEGKAHDKTASKAMQVQRWLRSGSRTCAIELLPLPSPDATIWHYDRFSNDPILRNRSTYSESMLPTRITAIKNAINKHKPRNIVFYSKKYLAHWQNISGVSFVEVDGLHIAQVGDTSFICTIHPTMRIKGEGRKLAYWENVGAQLANK